MAKEKLSVLIFSRNETRNLLELIRDIYDIADQIVVVDSSEGEEKKRLMKGIEKLRKVDFFWVIALGYPDPLRMYGLSKCRNDWVLYLDTDERISEALKRDVNKIIQTKDSCAFAIKRFENRNTKKAGTFFTWQIRLYRRSYVRYRGILHEQPLIKGSMRSMGDRYYIDHRENAIGRDYWKMEKFERYSYESFNGAIINYASKLSACTEDAFVKTLRGKFIIKALALYEKLGLKKKNGEISNFDYLLLYSLRDFAYRLKSGNPKGAMTAVLDRIKWLREIRRQKSTEEGRRDFRIAMEIWKKGIIEYLGLDDEGIVLKLNKKYAKSKQGVDLLIKLLEDRYYGRYP